MPSPPAVATPEMPESVAVDIDRAASRYEELQRQGRELHFRVDDGGTVVVDVCTTAGDVLRTIPSDAALDIVGGAPLA